MSTRGRALIVIPFIIGLLAGLFALLSLFAMSAFDIPVRLSMPSAIRAIGVGVLVFGFLFVGWLFRYRNPAEILQSTYITLLKSSRRVQAHEMLARKEPLILRGPHRHVRHPLYFAVLVVLIGWWLLLDYTLLLSMAFFFFLWFTLVVIRFEERELRALFGADYEAYIRVVPMILPSVRPRWPRAGKQK